MSRTRNKRVPVARHMRTTRLSIQKRQHSMYKAVMSLTKEIRDVLTCSTEVRNREFGFRQKGHP
jgi:hypothetical protein